ncbi:MAG TPA: polymer-forming cytoskeletal protein, partial [Candidatus Manganitrophaceae bacterium]|nr:polymer-forming cytoskeletal protein [Candidatus Manganitrophaceae bacterium]
GKRVTLPADQVVDEDYFAVGEVVEIRGTVHGDVYAAGKEIRIEGTVDGDLLAAGGNVRVSGKVAQNARIAGGEVTVAGAIGRNLTAAGGKILLAENGAVGGNVTAAGDLTVSGRIGGRLRTMAGHVRVTSSAAVGGEVRYVSREAAAIEEGARIDGQVLQQSPPRIFDFSAGAFSGFLVGLFLFIRIISLISTLIIGIFLIALFPRFSREVVATLKQKPLASLGWGFVLTIAVPVIFIGLLVTLVGIPVAFILFPLYLISLYLARLVFILWIGAALLDRFGAGGHEGLALLIGLLIYSLLTAIPGPGGLITLLIIMVGLGAVLLTARSRHAAA